MPPKKNDLTLLVKKRLVLDSRIRSFDAYVYKLDEKTLVLEELRIRHEKINEIWSEFQEIQSNIEECVDDEEEASSHLMFREEFESIFYRSVGRTRELLVPNVDNSKIETPINQALSNYDDLRLPPLTLPNFAGDIDEWTSFFSIFNDVVHENPRYSDASKLKYLKNSLRGEAYGLIESLELTSANYIVALNLLKGRYDNPVRSVLKHVRSLFDLHKMERESLPQIRSLLDSSQKHLRALNGLHQPTESCDVSVIQLLTSKLESNTLKDGKRWPPRMSCLR